MLVSISSLLCADCSYDYIIVGGGAAGCIEARKISDNHCNSVLLLEAGSNYLKDPVILDPNWTDNANALFASPKYAITYPIAVSGKILEFVTYSEAHLLGGGGAHNFLLAVRGTPSIYNGWELDTGNSRWSYYGNILKVMKALEKYTAYPTTPANPAERGKKGPISVTQGPQIVPVPGDFYSSLSSQTLTPFVNDYNDPSEGDIGISAVQQFITPGPNSERSFSGNEYLGKVIDKNGHGKNGRKLTVLTKAKTLKINFDDDKRATSVTYSITDSKGKEKVKTAKLNKKGILILSAGSVQTPALLLRSGVGPAAQLHAAGVPVVLNSPNVGQNLQCQYGTSFIMTSPTIPIPFGSEAFLDGYPYIPSDGVRRIQTIGFPQGPVTEMLPVITNPNSRGSVTIVNNNPLIEPQVNIGIFTDGSYSTPGTDAFLQVSFFKIMKSAADAAGLTVLFPTPADYASDASLFAAATDLNHLTLQSHIVGTARMGSKKSNGVVDGDLNVFGLKNVKIGDNSIQPQTSNGNVCYPAYVIALVLCQTLGISPRGP